MTVLPVFIASHILSFWVQGLTVYRNVCVVYCWKLRIRQAQNPYNDHIPTSFWDQIIEDSPMKAMQKSPDGIINRVADITGRGLSYLAEGTGLAAISGPDLSA